MCRISLTLDRLRWRYAANEPGFVEMESGVHLAGAPELDASKGGLRQDEKASDEDRSDKK